MILAHNNNLLTKLNLASVIRLKNMLENFRKKQEWTG